MAETSIYLLCLKHVYDIEVSSLLCHAFCFITQDLTHAIYNLVIKNSKGFSLFIVLVLIYLKKLFAQLLISHIVNVIISKVIRDQVRVVTDQTTTKATFSLWLCTSLFSVSRYSFSSLDFWRLYELCSKNILLVAGISKSSISCFSFLLRNQFNDDFQSFKAKQYIFGYLHIFIRFKIVYCNIALCLFFI